MAGYLPAAAAERAAQYAALGLSGPEALYRDVPEQMLLREPLHIPDGMSELEAARAVSAMAAENRTYATILRGAGAYDHYIPSIVKYIPAKEEFLTAYTPYQAEISQGVLQSIFEFQTMICSPLLPFLFDTILQYGNPVKAHSPDHRFRKTRADIHSLHARNILHRLHKVTCKMFPQEIPVSHFKGKCNLLILKLLVGFRHHYFRQSYITD